LRGLGRLGIKEKNAEDRGEKGPSRNFKRFFFQITILRFLTLLILWKVKNPLFVILSNKDAKEKNI